MINKEYYIYYCYVDDELKYIGKGKGDRYRHCLSGKSHCTALNKDKELGKKIRVEKVISGLSETTALYEEAVEINKYKETLYNTQIPSVPKAVERMCVVGETTGIEYRVCGVRSVATDDIVHVAVIPPDEYIEYDTLFRGVMYEPVVQGFNYSIEVLGTASTSQGALTMLQELESKYEETLLVKMLWEKAVLYAAKSRTVVYPACGKSKLFTKLATGKEYRNRQVVCNFIEMID